jgi:hypothetical protein
MAILTNSLATYSQTGRREDIIDEVFLIDPQETPFISSIGRTTATNTYHEWQTQSLATASKSNFQVEGDDNVTPTAATARVRLGNYCAISYKVAAVSGTAQASNVAGVGNELDNQKMLKGVELRRDMELILLDNNAYAVGGTSTARECAGLAAYITNSDMSGRTLFSVAAGTGANAWNLAATTTAPLSLTILNGAIKEGFVDGGKPNMLLLSPTQKQKFSALTLQSSLGGAAQVRFSTGQARAMPLIGTVDMWMSDFGTLDVMTDVQLAADTGSTGLDQAAFLIDTRYATLASYRPMFTEDLAKSGDNTKFQVLAEYTLEVGAPKAHAWLPALTT